MPEGPQVARYARLQSARLIGRRVRVDSPNGRSTEVAAFFDGATLRAIEAIGKHLLYDFGDERYLHVHLGRFGNFHQGDMPLPEVRGILRLRLHTDAHWYELRGAIAIETYDDDARARLTDRIGPNPLNPAADFKRAYKSIVARRTPVGLQMMDQAIVAGIGNIYRSEVLFLSGVHPLVPGPSLGAKCWRAMWKDLTRLMLHGADVGRIVTTYPKDRKKPKGVVRSEDRFYAYHRAGLPCRRCGTLIQTMVLGNRNAYWCPSCQPEPAVDVAPSGDRKTAAGKRRSPTRKASIKRVAARARAPK